MATAYMPLTALNLSPLDGSAGNEAPALDFVQSSGAAPAPRVARWAFDDTANEHVSVAFRMPGNYASDPVLKIDWYAAATSGDVVWCAELSAITESDAATPENKTGDAVNAVDDTVDGTTLELNQCSITLTNADSVAAGDLVMLVLYRDPEDASGNTDTLVGDAYLLGASLEFTTT